MLKIEKIDTNDRSQANRFLKVQQQFYVNNPNWVPPIRMDILTDLNKNKHPFYEHSDADFFIAVRDGKDVGRIAAIENRPFNKYHQTKDAEFYYFECENNQETANALFERVFEWARNRGLNHIVGPKGVNPLDGYGIQVDGFEMRRMMTMMNYNPPYYSTLIEALGFEKEVDFISCYLNADQFRLPERVHRIAERVQSRGTLRVIRFGTKDELKRWAPKIGVAYNQAFVQNWEYYPLSDRELNYAIGNLLSVAVPRLIKIIVSDEKVVGFLFGFPDISAAIQRSGGRLFPFGLIDMLLELKRTRWIAINGAGILPEYQGRGGNALLYSEMEKTVRDSGFIHAELTQVAETATLMRNDLMNVGSKPIKNHRVYQKHI